MSTTNKASRSMRYCIRHSRIVRHTLHNTYTQHTHTHTHSLTHKHTHSLTHSHSQTQKHTHRQRDRDIYILHSTLNNSINGRKTLATTFIVHTSAQPIFLSLALQYVHLHRRREKKRSNIIDLVTLTLHRLHERCVVVLKRRVDLVGRQLHWHPE